MTNQLKGQKLRGRALFSVSGEDRFAFLQGLITNDIHKIENGSMIYSCLLTPQGKYLFDFFAFQKNDKIMIDCEAHRVDDFIKRLKIFKLRSKVVLEKEEGSIYAFWDAEAKGFKDTRHEKMGVRFYDVPDFSFQEDDYTEHRFALGIPEGDKDMQPSFSTVQEGGLDDIGAVDWNKGCYMGQELTARVHYRGLIKKKLYPFVFDGVVPALQENVKDKDGNTIGEIRSVYKNRGFALLKVEPDPSGQELKTENVTITVQ